MDLWVKACYRLVVDRIEVACTCGQRLVTGWWLIGLRWHGHAGKGLLQVGG